MLTCIDLIERIIRWRLISSGSDNEGLFFPGMVYQVPNNLSRLLHPLDTCDCKSIDKEVSTFDSSFFTSDDQLKTKRVLDFSLLGNSFETFYVLIRSHTTSQTPVDDNLNNGFNANDWMIAAKESQVLDDLNVSLSTLALLEAQKYYKFCHIILASKAGGPSSGCNEGDDGL